MGCQKDEREDLKTLLMGKVLKPEKNFINAVRQRSTTQDVKYCSEELSSIPNCSGQEVPLEASLVVSTDISGGK